MSYSLNSLKRGLYGGLHRGLGVLTEAHVTSAILKKGVHVLQGLGAGSWTGLNPG